MDLSDPRRRLQVLNNSNPSIRQATAPQPKITVTNQQDPNTPRLLVGNTVIPQSPTASSGVPIKPKTSFYDKVNAFSDTASDKIGGGIGRGLLRGVDYLVPGKDTLGTQKLSDIANEWDRRAQASAAAQKDQGAAEAGAKFGSVVKGTADLATLALGSSAVEQGAARIPQAANLLDKLSNGGRVAKVASKVLGTLPGSLTGSGIDLVQTAGRGQETNPTKSVGIGTAVDVAVPFLGKGLSKVSNLFKGGKSASKGIVQDIISEVDPASIERTLGVDKEVAGYLANETNPDAIKQVLQNLSVDPNFKISDDVRKRLQDEGITAVKQDPNAQYPAEYNNGVITARDQQSLDSNVYHEIGHSVWENKLTPEERALFKGDGAASKEAVGRAGYTAEDVNSEDFSNYMRMALQGQMDQVPAEYQDVISKYAGVAKEQADSLGKALPGAGHVTTQDTVQKALDSGDIAGLLPPLTPRTGPLTNDGAAGFVMGSKPENIKIGKDIKSIDNELEKVRQGTSTKSPDEIRQLVAKKDELTSQAAGTGQATEKLAQDAQAASKVQTGVSDGQVDGTGKTTSQQATGDVSGAGLEGNTELGGKAVKTAENGSNDVIPQKAQDIVPEGTDPETTKAVQDFLDSVNREGGTLDRAQAGYDTAQKARKAETAARFGKGNALYDEAGGGEQGFRAKLGSLRGKKTASGFTPSQVDPQVEKTLLDAVEKSNLRSAEKFNTQNALRKVWGANPEKPTASDINNIRTFVNKNFGEGKGDEIAAGIQKAIDSGRNWKDVAAEVAGLPRALMATGDLSGGFRQAMPLGTRFPKEWARANKLSVEWAAKPKNYEAAMREIADSPNYQTVQDLMGVDLTGVGAMQDEAFIGSGLAEKIPGAGIGVKAADRAYTGVLTKLRWDVANKIIDDAGGVDNFLKSAESLYGDKTKDYLRAWGEVVNTFTGRGGKKGGMLDQHMKTLSTGLFAPRLWAANIQRLNPVWYARLAKTNPQAAKLAVQSQATFLTMAGSILGLASFAGAQVGTDPRSADFGKIKVGNTRYDILGGQQQNIVQIMRQKTGEKVNSETGDVTKLGDGFGAKTRFDLAVDMLNNKANPLLGFGIKLAETTDNTDTNNPIMRKDQYGNDFNVATEGSKLGIPLGIQGAYETSKDLGNVPKGIAMNAPSFLGVGVQTYGTTPTKDQGTDTKGNKVFSGKVTPEMVTDTNGQPMLDDKGRVIKVKFPKDATELEKQAILKAKQNESYTSLAKRNMSKEDRAIYKMGEADKASLDEEQTKKYDQLKTYVENYGKPIDVPKEVKDTASKNFYQKYNSMSKEDQKAWLQESPDDNSKSIATQLNKERSKGLDEYKPSNELAKAYAEYQKDLGSHPEYTEVDKRNKAKAFQTFSYKLNFSTDQRDIFSEGGSADLRTLMDQGQVGKPDLDAAVKLDNDLYNSGLSSSLKFSKTFRKDYGYGLPDGGGVNKRLSFSGGNGSSNSVNQHLADYLPSSKSGSSPAPQFSSKRRGSGISFKDVNAPSKSNNRKVTINL